MPFPNEHACRLRDPDDFKGDSFRRASREHEGKPYDVIMGRLKGEETMTEQAYRYPKEEWEASEARRHCEEHDGSFEPASRDGERSASTGSARTDEGGGEPRPYGRTRSYGHITTLLFNTPWAIMPEKLAAMVEVLNLRLQGVRFTVEEIHERMGAARVQRSHRRAGSIAVLPLYGVIAQRANLIMQASGGTSTEEFAAAFREVSANEDIRAIVIDIDSPGGSVHGVEELAREIYEARSKKPVVAVANSLAASGAYWLGTQADEFVITPSGLVGSIGIVAEHVDLSRAEEMAGIKTTVLTAGKFKGEGSPHEPLTDEAKAHVQTMMSDFYDMFVNAVARGRGVAPQAVREGFGEGRVIGAKAAMQLGMVDRIATLDQVLNRLGATTQNVNASRARTDGAGAPNGQERLARLQQISFMKQEIGGAK